MEVKWLPFKGRTYKALDKASDNKNKKALTTVARILGYNAKKNNTSWIH